MRAATIIALCLLAVSCKSTKVSRGKQETIDRSRTETTLEASGSSEIITRVLAESIRLEPVNPQQPARIIYKRDTIYLDNARLDNNRQDTQSTERNDSLLHVDIDQMNDLRSGSQQTETTRKGMSFWVYVVAGGVLLFVILLWWIRR